MSQSTTSPVAAQAGKYLTLSLDNEAYAVAVLKVREIIRLQSITPLPQAPRFVKGVINLRGRVVPIIDLRVKFGVNAAITGRTCIVVTQIRLATKQVTAVGLIVDAVEEVANLAVSDIEPPPELGSRVDTSYLLGLAKVKGQVKLILDIDRVVADDTLDTSGVC